MSQRSRKRSGLAAEEILRFAQNDERGTRLIGVILTVLLAVSMIPVVGIQTAFADEPAERPATTGGDATLEGYAAESTPVAVQREDGMYVAGGLVYTVTDGGLSLVGFDGLPQGEDALKEIVVPEAVSVDGKDAAVVAVSIAEGNIAESVVSLTLPQSTNNVDTVTLAPAFPNLASVEVVVPKASSAPVVAGAAAMKAAYSSFGGILYKNVRAASESDASQTTLTKELVWAPPATVVARIPAECTSIASGAFTDVKDLKTVVCFGVMEDIAAAQKADDGTITPGAFTDEQIQTVNVIVPQTGTVVSDSDHISADVAVTDDSTMNIKREAWWKSGFASDRITLGEVYGSTTNTLPVTEEGTLGVAEAEVAYAPETTQNSSSRKAGIKPPESAIPTPVPDDDQLDVSESGLVFTHLADMTLSVSWKGDPTATPSHLDIPAYVTIDGVAYPVTEIAANAFEGAVFLTSATIPEGVTAIGDSAFANCANLADAAFPSTLKTVAASAFDGVPVEPPTTAPGASAAEANSSTQAADASQPDALASEGEAAAPGREPDPVLSEELASGEGKEAPPGDDGLIPSDDFISTFAATNPFQTVLLTLYGNDIPSRCSVTLGTTASNAGLKAEVSADAIRIKVDSIPTDTTKRVAGWTLGYSTPKEANLWFMTESGGATGKITINTKSGYSISGLSIIGGEKYSSNSGGSKIDIGDGANGYIGFVRDEVYGTEGLSTESHNHDGTYVKPSTTINANGSLLANAVSGGSGGIIKDSSIENVDIKDSTITGGKLVNGTIGQNQLGTNAVTEAKINANAVTTAKIKDKNVTDAKIDTVSAGKVTGKLTSGQLPTDIVYTSAFGKVTYGTSLDGVRNGSAFPGTFRKGSAPAIPVPEREGYEFLGWTSGGDTNKENAVKDRVSIEKFFKDATGDVTLTAHWRDCGARYFYTDDSPYKDGSDPHTIAVKLTNDKGSFTKATLTFAKKDDAPVADASGVRFSTTDGSGTAVLGSADEVTANLVEVDGGWGVRVTVTVDAGALTPAVASYTDASYVASLAKMSYTFA